jgi:hypothetical protein
MLPSRRGGRKQAPVDEKHLKCYRWPSSVSRHLKTRLSTALSLLILLMFVHVHFLGDPCLLHGEHTAQAMESTLSCRTMSCLCFLHAVYAPVEVGFSVVTRVSVQEEAPLSPDPIRLIASDIFHPPRA